MRVLPGQIHSVLPGAFSWPGPSCLSARSLSCSPSSFSACGPRRSGAPHSSASQGAEGSLQAQQATNQLLALAAKQQFQLQQMMASQFRNDAVEQARRMQESREAQAVAKRFIGDGKARTPR